MALIICPECGRQVSDKAFTCPQCGFPISTITTIEPIQHQEILTDDFSMKNDELLSPTFPSDLEIGEQLVNWKGDAGFYATYDKSINEIKKLPNGKAFVALHKHGIRISVGFSSYDIHESQILYISKTIEEHISRKNKSVIGRAVVGGLLLGPLGAIVGVMSGLQKKEVLNISQIVLIQFWEIDGGVRTITLVCGSSQNVDAFIARQQAQREENNAADLESSG